MDKIRIAVLILLLCLLLQAIEAFFLRSIGFEKWTYTASAMLSGVAFFLMVLSIRRTTINDKVMHFESLLGKISLFVYCAHPIFVELLVEEISSTAVVWILSIVGSTVLGYLWSRIGCHYKNMIRK